jgi:histidinol-phosphate aminotransferase
LDTVHHRELSGGPKLTSANCVLTPGAAGALQTIFSLASVLSPRSIGILSPSFDFFWHLAAIHHVSVVKLPFVGSDLTDLDVERVLEASPPILLICRPNNPTGSSLFSERFADLASRFVGLIVIDEAYADFAPTSCLDWALRSDGIVVIRSLSKGPGLANLRIGAIVGQATTIGHLARLIVPYVVADLVASAATRRLSQLDRVIDKIREIQVARDALAEDLRAVAIVDYVFPSDANFLCARLTCSAQEISAYLLERGVFLRRASHALPNCVRVSVQGPTENRRLVEVLDGFG